MPQSAPDRKPSEHLFIPDCPCRRRPKMRVVARGDASRLMGVADEQPASLISLRSLVAPFASLGAGLLGAAAPPPPPLKEQRTGVVFPGELEYCADHKGCPVITGAG